MMIAEALDVIGNLVKNHRYYLGDDHGEITTHDDTVWILTWHPANELEGIHPHYALSNDRRSVAFENTDELKGWLRCHRTYSHLSLI